MGKPLALGAVLFVLVAMQAGAQPMLQKGVRELSVHVSPDFEGAVGDMLNARAGFGLFVRDRLSIRATLDYAVLEDVAGEDSDYRMSRFGFAGEYQLRGGGARLVPYVGLGVGWQSSHFGELEESALIYGPRGGLRYFLADNVSLDLEVTYHWAGADVFINDFVAEDTDVSSAIGLRVSF
jgi:hypothetical protein